MTNEHETLHGFAREDLDAISEGLDSYEKTVNVGGDTGFGDQHLESTTAAAARFIRAALAAPPVEQQAAIIWPPMPPIRGQSAILFEDGYAEGWAKCLTECKKAAQAAQPAAQAEPQRCQQCIDRQDGFYGSYAPPCPTHDDDGKPRATPPAPTEPADLHATLAEADRRAGAAERELAGLREDAVRLARVRDKMKEQWGASRLESFDVVWSQALEFQRQAHHLLDDLVTQTTDEHGLITYAAKNDLLFSNMIAALHRIGDGHAARAALAQGGAA